MAITIALREVAQRNDTPSAAAKEEETMVTARFDGTRVEKDDAGLDAGGRGNTAAAKARGWGDLGNDNCAVDTTLVNGTTRQEARCGERPWDNQLGQNRGKWEVMA